MIDLKKGWVFQWVIASKKPGFIDIEDESGQAWSRADLLVYLNLYYICWDTDAIMGYLSKFCRY